MYLLSFSDINTFTMTGTTQLRVAPVSSYFVLKIRVDYGIIGDGSKVRGRSHNSDIVKMLLSEIVCMIEIGMSNDEN